MSLSSRLDGRHHVLTKKVDLSLGQSRSEGLAHPAIDQILQPRAQCDGKPSLVKKIATTVGVEDEYNWFYPIRDPHVRGFQYNKWAPDTNRFGKVRTYVNGKPTKNHQGVDIRAPIGTPVYAVRTGTVKVGHSAPGKDYGTWLTIGFKIRTGEMRYAFYGHLSEVLVRDGAQVAAGACIAKSGATGNASSTENPIPTAEHHLHFGISRWPVPKPGSQNWVDPGLYMKLEDQARPESDFAIDMRPS